MQSTSFLHTQIVLRALEFAIAKNAFSDNPRQKKAAQTILQQMKSNRSVSGRHQQLMQMLTKGATLDQMMRSSGSSRRTVFRYLNQFENAGIDISLEDGRYRLKSGGA